MADLGEGRRLLVIHHPPYEGRGHLDGRNGQDFAFGGFPRRLEAFGDYMALDGVVCGHILDRRARCLEVAPWGEHSGLVARPTVLGCLHRSGSWPCDSGVRGQAAAARAEQLRRREPRRAPGSQGSAKLPASARRNRTPKRTPEPRNTMGR